MRRDERGAERLAERVTVGIHDEVEAQKRAASARGRHLWRPLLALAASLAIVADGVWWLSQRPDASLALRWSW